MSEIRSGRYCPNEQHCCEACAFRRGEHAEWCPLFKGDPKSFGSILVESDPGV